MKPRPFDVLAGVSLVLCVFSIEQARFAAFSRAALQQALLARTQQHQLLANSAVKQAADFIAAHPKPSTADIEQMNSLDNESNRLNVEQNALVASLLKVPLPVSPLYLEAVYAGLILPAIWLIHRTSHTLRLKRRIRNQCCIECGYDLRATPDRCPECGTIPETTI